MKRIIVAFSLSLICITTGVAAALWYLGVDRRVGELFQDERIDFNVFQLVRPGAALSKWDYLPDPVASNTANILFLSSILGVLASVLASLNRRANQKLVIHGSAKWATNQDLRGAGLTSDTGVFIGALSNRQYLRHDGPEHYSVIAPSRSGKGAGIVIPTLLTWPGSVIVHDLKEENWIHTAGQRSQFGRVIRFSPTTRDSARFNPLREVRLGVNEVKDVQNIADMIVDPDGSGYSDHWIKTGHSLLVGTILHLLYVGKESEKNLSGVANFLSQSDKTLIQTLKEMKNVSHIRDNSGNPLGSHPVVAGAVRDMLNKADNERSGVLSTAKSFLDLYRDPVVAWNTQESDFAITDLTNSERPVSLYLVVPPPDIPRLKPLTRLMTNQFCRRLTEELNPNEKRQRLLLMLDEFPALGRLEFFETALGFLAGYGIKAMLVSQSVNQLRKVYGANNSILDNTHVRVFYAPNTIETAEYISKSLGTSTQQYEAESETNEFGSFLYRSRSRNKQFVGRPLLTPREVMELPSDESLVFVGNRSPIKAKKIRYFADCNFIRRVTDPPPLVKTFEGEDGPNFWRERVQLNNAEVETDLNSNEDNLVPFSVENMDSKASSNISEDDGFIA